MPCLRPLCWQVQGNNSDARPQPPASVPHAPSAPCPTPSPLPPFRPLLLQVQGNNKLKVGLKSKNRLLLREAIDFYNKGLAIKCSDTAVNVALHNNRAHVNSLLGG